MQQRIKPALYYLVGKQPVLSVIYIFGNIFAILRNFFKTNRNFGDKSVMYVCQKHIECGQTMAIVAPFCGNTVRKSHSFNTINAALQLFEREAGMLLELAWRFHPNRTTLAVSAGADSRGMEGKNR